MAIRTDHSCCDPEFLEEVIDSLPPADGTATSRPGEVSQAGPEPEHLFSTQDQTLNYTRTEAVPQIVAGQIPGEDELPVEVACEHCASAVVPAPVPSEATEPGDSPTASGRVVSMGQSTSAGSLPPTAAPTASTGRQPKVSFPVRVASYLSIVVLVLGTGILLVRPMDIGTQAVDYSVELSMNGFTPPSLRIPAGHAVTVRLVNKESPFHASGAEHQFAIDAIGINEKLEAKTVKVITIPAQKPGVYTFYCDVCCGGKRSPNMNGTLTFYDTNQTQEIDQGAN